MRYTLCATLALSALVSACGGSISTVSPLRPTHMVVLGDENSALVAATDGSGQGRKYTINAVDSNGATVCASHPLWVQSIANYYNSLEGANTLFFDACRPSGVATDAAATITMNAKAGTTTAEAVSQIDALTAQAQAGSVDPSQQLVTVLVGQNDILNAYKTFDGTNAEALKTTVKNAGASLGQAVVRLMGVNGKILLAYPVDIEHSPWALAEAQTPTVAPTASADRRALLSDLVQAWRDGFNANAKVDGHHLALVSNGLVQQYLDSDRAGSSYGLDNRTDSACTDTPDGSASTGCTGNTLVSGATVSDSGSNYLWAHNTVPAQKFQYDLGELAKSRLANSPL